MICKKCGKENRDHASFCIFCGAALDDPAYDERYSRPEETDQYSRQYSSPEKKKKFRFTARMLLLPLFILLISGVLLFFEFKDELFSKKEEPEHMALTVPSAEDLKKTAESGAIGIPAESDPVPVPEDKKEEPYPDAASLSTDECPDPDDFSWYESYKDGTYPDTGHTIYTKEFDDIRGGWKGHLIYDPDQRYGAYSRDLFKTEISGTADAAVLSIDWQQMLPEGEAPVDTSHWEDSIYHGSMNKKKLYLTGAGNISIKTFFFYNGKEYGTGTLTAPDGTPAEILLVRP